MDSKNAILILGFLAMVLISSEVSARDLTETSTNTKKGVVEQTNNGSNDISIPPIRSRPNPSRPYHPPHPPHSHGCGQNGCCGLHIAGFCSNCCSYAGESVNVQVKGNTHN